MTEKTTAMELTLDELFDGTYIPPTVRDTSKPNICVVPHRVLTMLDNHINAHLEPFLTELKRYKAAAVELAKEGKLNPSLISKHVVKNHNKKGKNQVTERVDYKLVASSISKELLDKIRVYATEDSAAKIEKYKKECEKVENDSTKTIDQKKADLDMITPPVYRFEVGETIKMFSTRKIQSNSTGITATTLILDFFLRNLMYLTLIYSSYYGKDIVLDWLCEDDPCKVFTAEQKEMYKQIEPLIKLCTSIQKPIPSDSVSKNGFKQDVRMMIKLLCGVKNSDDAKDGGKDKSVELPVKDEVRLLDEEESTGDVEHILASIGFTNSAVDDNFIDTKTFGKLDQKNTSTVVTIVSGMLCDVVNYIAANASRSDKKGPSADAVMLSISKHYAECGVDVTSIAAYVNNAMTKLNEGKKKKKILPIASSEFTEMYLRNINMSHNITGGISSTTGGISSTTGGISTTPTVSMYSNLSGYPFATVGALVYQNGHIPT